MNMDTPSDCELLGDEGIILQTALAVLSFGTLLGQCAFFLENISKLF